MIDFKLLRKIGLILLSDFFCRGFFFWISGGFLDRKLEEGFCGLDVIKMLKF